MFQVYDKDKYFFINSHTFLNNDTTFATAYEENLKLSCISPSGSTAQIKSSLKEDAIFSFPCLMHN